MIDYLLGIVGKRFVDLRAEEFALLLLIVLACLFLVAYALSSLVAVARKLDSQESGSGYPRRMVRKGLERAAEDDDYRRRHYGHTD